MFGLESLIAFGTPVVSGLFADVIKSKGGELLKRYDINLKIPIERQLEKASREYVRNYADRHGTLKTVCVRMDAPVKLDEVYTAVQLLDRSDVRYFESADALQGLFRQVGKRGFEFREAVKQDGILTANQHQYLVVLGSPGVGKSTFLRKVGLEALKGKNGSFAHECIPVFLTLRLFDKDKSIETQIAEQFANCGFDHAIELSQAALEKGKLLVLFDGLDEVPIDRLDQTITQIQNLVDRYPQNRYIASCRIAAYKGGFPRFKDVTVAAFDDKQIEEFIRHWFRLEPETADSCWELLKQPQYEAAKELAQTPLLLTLLCVVYDESMDFPKNRSRLYGEALDVLMKKWAAEKRLQHNPIYRELSIELERELLSEIAFDSFESDRLFFSKSEVVEQIRKFLVDNLNAPKHLDGEAVLEAIEVQQGLLVERARETYSFSHLTLQEYLTAKYIVDNNQINWMVEHHLTNPNWREVFFLVAGLMSGRKGADDLLLTMEKQVQICVNNPKLVNLLQWAENSTTGSTSSYKPATKRAAVIFLAINIILALDRVFDFNRTRGLARSRSLALGRARLRAFDLTFTLDCNPALDRDFYRNYPKLNDALDHALEQALDCNFILKFQNIKAFNLVDFSTLIARINKLTSSVRDEGQPYKVRRAIVEQILGFWIDALKLDPEITQLSEEEALSLLNYLHINKLIVDCKEAAVRVSVEVWEAIESRMLKV